MIIRRYVDGEEGVVGKTSERNEAKSAGPVTLNLRPIEMGREYLLYHGEDVCATVLIGDDGA